MQSSVDVQSPPMAMQSGPFSPWTGRSPRDLGVGPSSPSPKKGPSGRAKTGCITCRIRKKRCDEAKPHCDTCSRLGIECMGYGTKRPRWLKGQDNSSKAREKIRLKIQKRRGEKKRAGSGTTEGEDLDEEGDDDGDVGGAPAQADRGLRDDPSVPTPDEVPWDSAFQPTAAAVAPAPVTDATVELATAGRPSWDAGIANTSAQLWNQTDLAAVDTGVYNPSTVMSFDQTVATTAGSQMFVQPSTQPLAQHPDPALDEIWKILFGAPPSDFSAPAFPPIPSPLSMSVDMSNPPLYPPFPLSTSPPPALTVPTPGPEMSIQHVDMSPVPDLGYLHHYLNVVLPLQYRFVFKSMGDLVTPLAMAHSHVLNSVSSLAALHLAAQRSSTNIFPLSDTDDTGSTQADLDAVVAKSSHRDSLQRLRFLSSKDLTSEDVIVSALFAISFHLFQGGTSKEWTDVLETAQRCLEAALASSPEVTPSAIRKGTMGSPWQRYRPLIAVMVWMDILGSVTQNKGSRLLPTYRRLLSHFPAQRDSGARLAMEHVWGCDDTTLLAMAETVQLSEWKEHCEAAGCLSINELVTRATQIEKLLEERAWRESLLDAGKSARIEVEGEDEGDDESKGMVRIMSDIFYAAAKVFLAAVVNGPFPRVPEIANSVTATISALTLLDIHHPDQDINRALILPITLAGCHAESSEQKDFFRGRFQRLGPEAAAFGNSKQALNLMEEVWRLRAERGAGGRVCWRQTMRSLGWERGILLI